MLTNLLKNKKFKRCKRNEHLGSFRQHSENIVNILKNLCRSTQNSSSPYVNKKMGAMKPGQKAIPLRPLYLAVFKTLKYIDTQSL